MDVRTPPNFRSRPIEIRPDVIHIHTEVYNIITQRVPNPGRNQSVLVMGEDFDAVLIPEPIPQPGGLDAVFSVVTGSSIRDTEFSDMLSAPFFSTGPSVLTISPYSPQVHRILDFIGNTNLNISTHTTFERRTITGGAEITDIEVE